MIIQETFDEKSRIWSAYGQYKGRRIVTEGNTREEARNAWEDHAIVIDADINTSDMAILTYLREQAG